MDRKFRRHKRILRRVQVQKKTASSSSPSTPDDFVSDEGLVPLGDSDDGIDNEDGNDSNSSVDVGIRADLISERIVDTGIWQDTLSKRSAAFVSEVTSVQAMPGVGKVDIVNELPTIPRRKKRKGVTICIHLLLCLPCSWEEDF
jgi:hypothetical protein